MNSCNLHEIAGRQKVKLAAQLFSNTTANAIRRCHSLGFDLYRSAETADMIQLVNDWFDVLNSNIGSFGYPGKVSRVSLNLTYFYYDFKT